ncbi:(d)CMP kinase [bacterium]|nr:(d)CMP kinase [bacterium]
MADLTKNFIITVDGPSGAGKSTISKKIASRLNLSYIDTGAMYRSVAWATVNEGIDLTSDAELGRILKSIKIRFQAAGEKNLVFCNEHDITAAIRTPQMDQLASAVSSIRLVRDALLPLQREAAQGCSAIIDGRDAGTIIFPEAELKIYLDADLKARAQRRLKDQEGETEINLESVTKAIAERDAADSSRAQAPLCQAEDAILIDSTGLTIDTVCEKIIELFCRRFDKPFREFSDD